LPGAPLSSQRKEGIMTPKLVIVTDLGLLKAYRLETTSRGTPHLTELAMIQLEDAHRRLLEEVRDLAGRHISPTQHKWGAPLADDHNLRLEIKRRLVKKIAGHIRHFAQSTDGEPIWLVAHKEINRPILDELPAGVRRRVEQTVPRDLVKAGKRELIQALNLSAPHRGKRHDAG
jgi:hypothetical protein